MFVVDFSCSSVAFVSLSMNHWASMRVGFLVRQLALLFGAGRDDDSYLLFAQLTTDVTAGLGQKNPRNQHSQLQYLERVSPAGSNLDTTP